MGTLRKLIPLYLNKEITATTIEEREVPAYKTKLLWEVGQSWTSVLLELIRPNSPEELEGRIMAVITPTRVLLSVDPTLFYCANEKIFKCKSDVRNVVTLHDLNKEAEFSELLNPILVLSSGSVRIFSSIETLPKEAIYSSKLGAYTMKGKLAAVASALTEKAEAELRRLTNLSSGYYKYEQIPVEYRNKVAKLLAPEKQLNKNPKLLQLSALLQSHTFGVEIETMSGLPPVVALSRFGITTLRDGSINGPNPREYVTVPLSGYRGLQNLKNGAELLQSYCKVNLSCSLHINFGNLPSDKDFAVALYILYYRIQEDILDIFPEYLRDPVSIGNKRQNYADRLPTIAPDRRKLSVYSHEELVNLLYARIAAFYTGEPVSENFEGKDDYAWGAQSWHCSSRYVALNMLKFFHKEKTRLVEFRVHPPTTDPNKILTWLAICAAIIRYANNHKEELVNSVRDRSKFLLIDVLQEVEQVSPDLHTYLADYVSTLQELRYQQRLDTIMKANLASAGLRGRQNIFYKICQAEIAEDLAFVANYF